MALVGRPFAEVYGELVAYEPSWSERLKRVCGDEVGARKEIKENEQSEFADMLHIAPIWIAEKRARERGAASAGNQRAKALQERQTAVWFPTTPPRMPKDCRPGFPKAAFRDMCEEEAELRRWLHGVEGKLREHIERACQESYYIFTCFDELHVQEDRARIRLGMAEDDAFKTIKRSVFRAAPPDFFRTKAVERFGATVRPPTPTPQELSLEEQEALARAAWEREEEEGRRQTHQFLVDCYAQLLFETNHREVFERELLERAEVECLYPLVARCCREDFGFCYYHTPAVFLHLRIAHQSTSLMAEMCARHLAYTNRNASDVKEYLRSREASCAPPCPELAAADAGKAEKTELHSEAHSSDSAGCSIVTAAETPEAPREATASSRPRAASLPKCSLNAPQEAASEAATCETTGEEGHKSATAACTDNATSAAVTTAPAAVETQRSLPMVVLLSTEEWVPSAEEHKSLADSVKQRRHS